MTRPSEVPLEPEAEPALPEPYRIGPAPGAVARVGEEFGGAESPLDISVDAMRKLTHAYLNTNQSTSDIAMAIGVSTPLVRKAIKHFGLDKAKEQAISVMRQEEAAAYAEFLAKSRVPTAQRHLEISDQIVKIVGKLTEKVGDPTDEGFIAACTQLKSAIGTLRTLAEVLEKSSGVGARSVNLGGMPGSFQQAEEPGGRRPLISFNIGAAAPGVRQAGDLV